jgi:polyphenol oxidase
MNFIKPEYLYVSPTLSNFPEIIHGFSYRSMGDMDIPINRTKLLQNLNLNSKLSITAEQIHGTEIRIVSSTDSGSKIKSVDGLVYKFSYDLKQPILIIRVADCIPLLLYDPKQKVIAAVHAGWRSTLGQIASKTIDAMISLGTKPVDVRAVIGPHIGACCYDVDDKRMNLFKDIYEKDNRIGVRQNQKWYLDIGRINYYQLINIGILENHIDNTSPCTFDCADKFFSYRKNNKQGGGEFIGLISFK